MPKKIVLKHLFLNLIGKKHGKAAGMIRNTDIVNNSEIVVTFWDGESRGTKDSIKKAEQQGKKVLVIHYKK